MASAMKHDLRLERAAGFPAMTDELVTTEEQAEWLHEQSLFVATPTIDAKVHSAHYFAKLVLQELCRRYRIRVRFSDRPGDSLVTRARNKLAAQFLKSKMSYMLLVDSDISFQAPDIISLMLLNRDHEGIIGVPYPKKQVNWQRIATVCNHEKQHPIELMPAIGADFVTNLLDPGEWNKIVSLTQPQAVRHLGCGYMLIPRYVFEKLSEAGRKERNLITRLYDIDSWSMAETEAVRKWIMRRGPLVDEYVLSREEQQVEQQERMETFFEAKVSAEVDKDGNLMPDLIYYPSEDWWFCDRWREIDGTVWACLWMRSVHTGTYEYVGDMPAIAKVEEAL